MKNVGYILMAAGAAMLLGAAMFSSGSVRVAEFGGICACGVGYFFDKFSK